MIVFGKVFWGRLSFAAHWMSFWVCSSIVRERRELSYGLYWHFWLHCPFVWAIDLLREWHHDNGTDCSLWPNGIVWAYRLLRHLTDISHILSQKANPDPKVKGPCQKNYFNTALCYWFVTPVRLELTTQWLRVICSTNWATESIPIKRKAPSDFDAAKVCFFCYAPNESEKNSFLCVPASTVTISSVWCEGNVWGCRACLLAEPVGWRS